MPRYRNAERWQDHPWHRRDIKELLAGVFIAAAIAIPTSLVFWTALIINGGR